MANPLDSQTSSKISLSLSLSRSLPLPLPPPRPVWLSPPHPPPRRKAPKAVDEDLYRISPELLLAKHRRCSIWGEVYGTGLTEIEIGGEQRSGIKVAEVRKSSNSVHDKGFNFDDGRLMRGAWWSEPNPDMCKMTKLAIIPCTVLLETIFFRKKFSRNIQLSLMILLLGVGIATVTDLQLNVLGSVLSLLAVVTTCVAQIMTNTIQKKFKVSSTQLLYQSCPYQAITLFITGPFVDGLLTNLNVFAFKYTPQVLAFIVLSCLISVSVNFSTFLVIGKTSPVTYQVLGHLKTCLVLAFGYGLLHDPFSWRNILGILFALVGMILYSYCCTLESQQKASEASVQLSQAKESESEPLMSVENGASVLADSVVSKSPAWSSNKDLRA